MYHLSKKKKAALFNYAHDHSVFFHIIYHLNQKKKVIFKIQRLFFMFHHLWIDWLILRLKYFLLRCDMSSALVKNILACLPLIAWNTNLRIFYKNVLFIWNAIRVWEWDWLISGVVADVSGAILCNRTANVFR